MTNVNLSISRAKIISMLITLYMSMALQAAEYFFASDDLGGKNLCCEENKLFVNYNVLDNKRYNTNNNYLVDFDIGIREGTDGHLNTTRYNN